jgi:hypothetical protein
MFIHFHLAIRDPLIKESYKMPPSYTLYGPNVECLGYLVGIGYPCLGHWIEHLLLSKSEAYENISAVRRIELGLCFHSKDKCFLYLLMKYLVF